jgi:hypothetical protein
MRLRGKRLQQLWPRNKSLAPGRKDLARRVVIMPLLPLDKAKHGLVWNSQNQEDCNHKGTFAFFIVLLTAEGPLS